MLAGPVWTPLPMASFPDEKVRLRLFPFLNLCMISLLVLFHIARKTVPAASW
jgi:hypothetical protein